MRIKLCSVAILLSFLLTACIDESGYEVDEIRLTPSLALPLAYGELKISDLLNDDDLVNIKTYPDGLLYLAYEQQLNTQGIGDLFDVPDKSVNRSFILPGGILPPVPADIRSDSISHTVDLGLAPEVLNEIALKSGQLSYTTSVFPANSSLNYEVQIILPDFIARSTNRALTATARGSGSVSLADYTMRLVNNQFTVKLVLVLKRNTASTNIPQGTSVNVQLNFQSLDFRSLKGFFGDRIVPVPAETIDVSALENVFQGAEVSFAQPKIGLTIVNEYGVPCVVDFKTLEARNSSDRMSVQLNPPNPVTLNSPASLGASATTNLSIVNVNELMQFAPNQFYYLAETRINQGLTSGSNFLADTSKLTVKMNIEVPFYGHASGITLRDTVEVDWSDLDGSQVETAAFKLKLTNQLPLDGNIQFFLTDASYRVIGTLLADTQTDILKGSTVNAGGELLTAGIFDDSIDLDKARLDNLFQAKYVIIAATISTSKDGSGNFPDVKFKSTYGLAIEAGILAKLKLNVKL